MLSQLRSKRLPTLSGSNPKAHLSLALSFLLGICPQLSHAHSAAPYLLPEQFDSKNNSVSLQSAITVEKFYSPSRNYQTRFLATTPDGIEQEIKPIATLERFTLLDLATGQNGTYRVKTADQPSSVTDYALVDGRWLRVRTERPATTPTAATPPATTTPAASTEAGATATPRPRRFIYADELPANAQKAKTEVIQLAETYLSKGAPSALAKPTGTGLELIPITHPNEIFASDGFEFIMQFDGKPVPKLELELYRGAGAYDQDKTKDLGHVYTDEQGRAKLDFKDTAGVYLLFMQYPPASTDASKQPPARLYNYGLTLQATP